MTVYLIVAGGLAALIGTLAVIIAIRGNGKPPRTRCSNCGEIYYGDTCPMCGHEF